MQKAICSEVALLGGSEYPDHGAGIDDPGLGMLELFVRQLCVWVSSIEQDGVERTINTVDGIVVWVIGLYVSGALEVITKAAETLAYLDGGALQQGLFKLLGINLVVTDLGDGLFQKRQRILFTGGCQAMA
ncbi:hypothetical protein [Aeromonas hydrophila]|uniref:hypothetical protein n=1 Tax=Aeromonas hydrophila TaxID=644 RepID=UPI0004D681C7|nr:hypothetical protein [Aeromonas hydrophila]KER62510.1 hypothetical protein HR52_05550 [Aeromonas hydrophila]OCA66206.1 hypothetical protein A9R12_08740 [Aeromonas hydrophila]OCX99138.1 hypothetical protein A9X70_22170 [Aeromonas hydrophila]OCX99158.1 hypothetical protein A9X69_21865 [Aeromonas hydrophila]